MSIANVSYQLGTYRNLHPVSLISCPTYKSISYRIEDGRNVEIAFTKVADKIIVAESFETEKINPEELQRAGWQAILDNFKNYAESVWNKLSNQ